MRPTAPTSPPFSFRLDLIRYQPPSLAMEYKTAESGQVSLLEMQVPQVKDDLTVEEIFTELQKAHENFLSPSITSATQIKRLLGMLVTNTRTKDASIDSIQISDLHAGFAEQKQQIQEQLAKVGEDEDEVGDDDGDRDIDDNLTNQLGHTNDTGVLQTPDRFTGNDEESTPVPNENRFYDDDKDFDDDDDFEEDEDEMQGHNLTALQPATISSRESQAEADDYLEEIEEIDEDIAAEDDDSDDFEFDPLPDLGDDNGRFP